MADYTSLYEEQIQARQNIGRTKSDLAASSDQTSILMYMLMVQLFLGII